MMNLITFIVTLILGLIAKKYKKINTYLIPLQNLLIGIVMMIIEFIMTKDLNMSIMLSGLLAGGTYDLFHNLALIFGVKK